eukprot:scaffold5321_cov202-Skeletonema_menzelii.AAC.1
MITFVSAALALLISFRTNTSPFIENIKASAAVKAGEAAPFGGLCDALNQATASFTENYETNGADLLTFHDAIGYGVLNLVRHVGC